MKNSTPTRVAMSAAMLILTVLLSVGAAPAQSHLLRVTIPFDFYVGEKLMPAGDYEANRIFDRAVRLYNPAAKVSTAFMTIPLNNSVERFVSPKLVFNKYADDHFLSELWWGQSSAGTMTTPSQRETKLAKSQEVIRIETRARR